MVSVSFCGGLPHWPTRLTGPPTVAPGRILFMNCINWRSAGPPRDAAIASTSISSSRNAKGVRYGMCLYLDTQPSSLRYYHSSLRRGLPHARIMLACWMTHAHPSRPPPSLDDHRVTLEDAVRLMSGAAGSLQSRADSDAGSALPLECGLSVLRSPDADGTRHCGSLCRRSWATANS